MKKLDIPSLGYRNIKTALSVLICLIIFSYDPFFAAISAVICMQSTVENTLKTGINRIIGTLVGGVLGIVFLYLSRIINISLVTSIITAIGVSFVIYICNLIKKPSSCGISSIVLIAIMIAPPTSNPIIYATTRVVQTTLGIVVALLVNKYINPPKDDANNIK